ncbi:ParA family protein [Dietzia cinnamea]|uniref:ParA family protein n=1 Tax=Dietzia cinnamea TaxID=321318 RepID=A0AAW5Q528_9ACTN|nr:ParA family protein [Dietzia cinnamea]MCT2109322.1 ParA family protein [Dietzia cinnamea]MCT2117320.1 ParA family protein [Dietzia cinnamea]MCT2173482.1 ParA family protein [Dietzia cinnamea]
MKTIAFFNHKGGVGKTTMLFNTAIEMARLGKRVLMVDLDAQANLTAISVSNSEFDRMYSEDADGLTVAHAFRPLVGGAGDVEAPEAHVVRPDGVWLAAGDIRLSEFEAIMPNAWTESLAGNERGFRVTSAPYRMIQELGAIVEADYAFVDLGPNVGGLNRSALIASDYLIVPMASDLFSIRALPSVGGALELWVSQWKTAKSVAPKLSFDLPAGLPKVLGYVQQQFNIYRGEATMAFSAWIERMPTEFQRGLLAPLETFDDGAGASLADPAGSDGANLGDLKNYHSLVPHAQNLRRAIFELQADDVIRGGQVTRARQSEQQFRELCDNIIARTS